ncbi:MULTISPECIES: TetR/AcrR family transcriptional regulator [unclassified Sphingomonas]|uniref:TetR/AcrR family transcriptional regulator n=1 Tax=unclassified Sphingomonas TaxID=196159 RepID=UPI00226A2CB6|nr:MULTISPECIES: TetR/AcrR family transcriptional regulator [unclassified Sphingomonas]
MSVPKKAAISRKPEVVKARILDAAQAEFMAAGYAGASTNRILELFGGSKPTMFRHYPTKREMFQAVVARIAARWSSEIDWQHIDSEVPAEWLRGFGGMALRWILGEDNIFVGRMAIAEGEAFPEVADIYRSLAVDPIEAVLSARLETWTRAGTLDCASPQRDAVAFLDLTLSGMVSRALYGVSRRPDDASLDTHVDFATDLFLHGRLARS